MPLLITEGNRQTSFTYDSDGRLLTRTVTDTSLGLSRTLTYSYTTLGLLATVDGPRTNVSDVTSYDYNTNGSLATVTNALGHVTTIVSRDYQAQAHTDPRCQRPGDFASLRRAGPPDHRHHRR